VLLLRVNSLITLHLISNRNIICALAKGSYCLRLPSGIPCITKRGVHSQAVTDADTVASAA